MREDGTKQEIQTRQPGQPEQTEPAGNRDRAEQPGQEGRMEQAGTAGKQDCDEHPKQRERVGPAGKAGMAGKAKKTASRKATASIYRRTFGMFLVTYLVLMLGFSIFLVSRERKTAGTELQTYAVLINSKIENTLQDFLDDDGKQLTDPAKAKKELLQQPSFFTPENTEIAIFTGAYELLYNTNNYWRCSYTKSKEGGKHYTGYAYLNPKDWFSTKEIKKIEKYLYAAPKPQKIGDLSGYSLNLKGFWLDDDGMIVPEKITVTMMHAHQFDEEGNLISGGGDHANDIIYHLGGENSGDLPYFEHGHIIPDHTGNPNSERRNELRQMVTNQSKLREAVRGFDGLQSSSQRIKSLIYRYYFPIPYQNTVRVGAEGDQDLTSTFWLVLGSDINIGKRCLPSLAFVWASCFLTFGLAAFALAKQTVHTYKQQERLENRRREITNALAHDLKTPLSIVSGYAENLQENIHTEKKEHYARQIQANVKRMDQIIHNMLELRKLEADSPGINFKEVALAEACKTIIDRYKPAWEDKLITVSLDGEAVIKADRSLMLRLIDNFFVNAFDNTPAGGSISMKILADTLEVYNSGSKIPEDKIAEIWQPFKKGDTARGRSKGTGLGLAIARTILELHKFPHGVKNCEDGVTFWFKFR